MLGYTIRCRRAPQLDTDSHKYYRYTLVTPNGSTLFGKQGDVVGISKWANADARRVALFAATLTPEDVDQEYFNDYTPEELAWSRSLACKMLAAEVYDAHWI